LISLLKLYLSILNHLVDFNWTRSTNAIFLVRLGFIFAELVPLADAQFAGVHVDAAKHLRLLVLGIKELTLLSCNHVFRVSFELFHHLQGQVCIVGDRFVHQGKSMFQSCCLLFMHNTLGIHLLSLNHDVSLEFISLLSLFLG